MTSHPAPPFDPWSWLPTWQETWLAGLDPHGIGQRLQQQRLARLIGHALQESPLYARRAAGAGRLSDFQPIGKAELMAHFDDWATDRRITLRAAEAAVRAADGVADAWLGDYLVWTSSGTSGEPGIFVQDATSLAAFDAIEALRLLRARSLPTLPALWGMGRRFAYVGAIGGPYAGHVSLQRLRRLVPPPWTPQITMISILEPLQQVAERLQALQPDVLITYPSCAVALAECQAQGMLRLTLDQVWVGGEQLTAAHRQRLRDVFGCGVRNSYGASEFYSIAFECGHGRLHLNDDWVVLEPVDAHGRPVPPGEFSHTTLLTNLANRAQPLLRYELHDRVRFATERCGCGQGFPVIEVQGRSDDALVLPATRGGTVTLLPLMVETVIEEEAQVTQFQLLHRPDGRFELRLPGQGADARATFARCRQALQSCFERQGATPQRLVHGAQPPQRDPGSGKLRRIIDLAAAR